MSNCLIAEYETIAAAKVGLEVLETDDFTRDNVSVVSNSDDVAAERLKELDGATESGSSSGSAPEGHMAPLGMLIGGTAAAPIATGTLIGPFIVAGPLVGMAVGAAVGSLLGSTDRWGVAEHSAADYEAKVKSGSILVIVHDVDEIRLNDASALLKTTDPKSLEKFVVEK